MSEPQKKKKKKDSSRKKNKAKLWAAFDDAVSNNKDVEIIYDKSIEGVCCNCGYNLHISDEGFEICTNKNCGRIIKDTLHSSPEWRYYSQNKGSDPTRCGMPINDLLHESSFGCKILCTSNNSYEMRKIKRYTEWQAMPYKEKSQYDEFQRITIVSRNAGISQFIIDDAMRFHKQISEQKTFRGLNRDGIIAASIYISCRVNNNPRTAKEIAKIFNLDVTSATRGCKNAIIIINELEENMSSDDKIKLCKTKPVSFIDRYCSKFNINNELTKLCKFIAHRIDNNQLIPENTPHSVAAGIVYFIGQKFNLNISKKDVNKITEISEVTINKCYKKLNTLLTDLIPRQIILKYNIN